MIRQILTPEIYFDTSESIDISGYTDRWQGKTLYTYMSCFRSVDFRWSKYQKYIQTTYGYEYPNSCFTEECNVSQYNW